MKFIKHVLSVGLLVAVLFVGVTHAYAANSAPVLDASKTPILSPVTEDPGAPTGAVGTLISSIVDFAVPSGQVDNVTDADGGLTGIAVIGVDTAKVTCYYSVDSGATWSLVGAVLNTSARLLAANGTNRIYCQPGLNINGTLPAVITFRAWDTTSGVDGGLADVSTNGGSTAFSTTTDTVNMNVIAVNDAPVATNLSAAETYSASTPLNLIDIVASDVDSSSVTAVLTLSDYAAGSLNTGTSGAVTSTYNPGTGTWTASGPIADVNTLLAGLVFTPSNGYSSNFTIATSVSDGVAAPATGSKAMTYVSTNHAPVAFDDAYALSEDSSSTVLDVLANDFDQDSDPLQIVSVTTPNHGGSAIIGSGIVRYTPASNFNGIETFSYTISDGVLTSTAVVTITVMPVNDAPIAVDDSYTMSNSASTTSMAVLDNDTDIDGDSLTITSVTPATGTVGSMTITDSNTKLHYYPAGAFCGTESFTYTISDGNGGSSSAKVTWEVICPTPPTVVSVTPTNGALNQTTTVPIVINFSIPMSTIGLAYEVGPCDGVCPTFTESWSNNNQTLTLTNNAPFKQDTTYMFKIEHAYGLFDLWNDMATFYSWKFTTVAPTPTGGSSSGMGTPWKPAAVTSTTQSTKDIYHFPRTLKQGMKGDDVVVLQNFLHVTPVVSKNFGLKTKAALIAYQKSHGLTADGILGPKSRVMVESELNK